MSPVSRGRNGRRKKTNRRSGPLAVVQPPEPCDCPTCTGEASGADDALDPEQFVEQLLSGAESMSDEEDPLDAEAFAALFLSGGMFSPDFNRVVLDTFIPVFEREATTAGLSMLLAMGAVAAEPIAGQAIAAADRLSERGVTAPKWAAEVREPVTVHSASRLYDTAGAAAVFFGQFRRSGRLEVWIVNVDYEDCGAAFDIQVGTEVGIDELAKALRKDARKQGYRLVTEPLDPAEFRWQVENALDARAVHDEDLEPDEVLDPDEGGPGYPALSIVLRARLRSLPESDKPRPPHADDDDEILQSSVQRPANDVAPVYQLRVDVRGAKPPIWRRLEVPADISLAGLHDVLQTAFGWEHAHMYVFGTPVGDFGIPDSELGHAAASAVTLEQIASVTGAKLRYTYDFGDDWEHDIVVEKVLDRDSATAYPRCVGGRRAGPPEDCGGIWGYAELLRILADPRHAEHQERLDWLGLEDAGEFDPAAFDADAVTRLLTKP